MKNWRRVATLAVATAFVLGSSLTAPGFALIGPYADWMQLTNGYRYPGDIGGPMDINEEYRWNVPVVTYAFDQSFLDYFGSNGVAAIESAIKMFNDLPPASQIVLTNFPLGSGGKNFAAASRHLLDLKSMTVALLLEQMGLASPTRNVFDLRGFDPILWTYRCEGGWLDWFVPAFIFERNFDPETLAPSHYVNEALFTGCVDVGGRLLNSGYISWSLISTDVVEFAVDPSTSQFSTACDWKEYFLLGLAGGFLSEFTRDDVGGLRYLLSSNNVNPEMLLPDVSGVSGDSDKGHDGAKKGHGHKKRGKPSKKAELRHSSNGSSSGAGPVPFVNAALRPGVERVSFVRQPYDSHLGRAIPVTNRFTDVYITNGLVLQQEVERVIAQPDFLFSAGDVVQGDLKVTRYFGTGTANWWNSAVSSNETNGGSGVIRPPIRIVFDKFAPCVQTYDFYEGVADIYDFRWASFDGTTNAPVLFPSDSLPSENHDLTIHLWLHTNYNLVADAHFMWRVPAALGTPAELQVSTNLSEWKPLGTIINYAGAVDWHHWRSKPQVFFRVVPR